MLNQSIMLGSVDVDQSIMLGSVDVESINNVGISRC